MKEISSISIVDYKSEYKDAFKHLNKEWIDEHFKMEAEDYYALDHPEENIIHKGGYILIALFEEEVLGVCALKKMNESKYDYELAKMAVSPKHHGKGIGKILGQAIVQKAKSIQAKTIFLESNTKLTPALNLYRKLGFIEILGDASPYERSDIQMVLTF